MNVVVTISSITAREALTSRLIRWASTRSEYDVALGLTPKLTRCSNTLEASCVCHKITKLINVFIRSDKDVTLISCARSWISRKKKQPKWENVCLSLIGHKLGDQCNLLGLRYDNQHFLFIFSSPPLTKQTCSYCLQWGCKGDSRTMEVQKTYKSWRGEWVLDNFSPSSASQMQTSVHCMNEYQGSTQKWIPMPQKSDKHDQGPKYLHTLKWCSLVPQQICKGALHGLNSPVESKPD